MFQIIGVTHTQKNTDINTQIHVHVRVRCIDTHSRTVQEASQGGFRGNRQVMVGTVIRS